MASADSSAELKQELLLVKFEDNWYDLTKWKFSHPGGHEILEHSSGLDVTDSVLSLHSDDAVARVRKMRPVSVSKLPEGLADDAPEPHKVDYREWQANLKANGFYDRNFLDEFRHCAPIFAMMIAGIYLGHTWPLTAIVLLGLAQQQAGWFAHDCNHGRGQYCNIMGRFVGGWICGMSRAWWCEKHNTHHVFTNCVGIDTDIHNDPAIFNFPPSKENDRWNRAYQHLYAAFLYPFLYFAWRKHSISVCIRDSRWSELIIELVPSYIILSFVPWYVALGSILWGGLCVAFVVTLSHESEEVHHGGPKEFIAAQFDGTRDIICPNWFMEWFFGGMQYQLEHHLFPTLPRAHYPRLVPQVQAYAKKHNLEYKASGLVEFLSVHYETLKMNALLTAL